MNWIIIIIIIVCRDVDVFGPKILLLKHILYWFFFYY
jgi:hypothetical protein